MGKPLSVYTDHELWELMESIRGRYLEKKRLNADGGPGSGNWGHKSVKGKKGGSAPGGGKHNRIETENGGFTSTAKQKKAMATPHAPNEDELNAVPEGSILITEHDGKKTKFLKQEGVFVNPLTGEVLFNEDILSKENVAIISKKPSAVGESEKKESGQIAAPETATEAQETPAAGSEGEGPNNNPTDEESTPVASETAASASAKSTPSVPEPSYNTANEPGDSDPANDLEPFEESSYDPADELEPFESGYGAGSSSSDDYDPADDLEPYDSDFGSDLPDQYEEHIGEDEPGESAPESGPTSEPEPSAPDNVTESTPGPDSEPAASTGPQGVPVEFSMGSEAVNDLKQFMKEEVDTYSSKESTNKIQEKIGDAKVGEAFVTPYNKLEKMADGSYTVTNLYDGSTKTLGEKGAAMLIYGDGGVSPVASGISSKEDMQKVVDEAYNSASAWNSYAYDKTNALGVAESMPVGTVFDLAGSEFTKTGPNEYTFVDIWGDTEKYDADHVSGVMMHKKATVKQLGGQPAQSASPKSTPSASSSGTPSASQAQSTVSPSSQSSSGSSTKSIGPEDVTMDDFDNAEAGDKLKFTDWSGENEYTKKTDGSWIDKKGNEIDESDIMDALAGASSDAVFISGGESKPTGIQSLSAEEVDQLNVGIADSVLNTLEDKGTNWGVDDWENVAKGFDKVPVGTKFNIKGTELKAEKTSDTTYSVVDGYGNEVDWSANDVAYKMLSVQDDETGYGIEMEGAGPGSMAFSGGGSTAGSSGNAQAPTSSAATSNGSTASTSASQQEINKKISDYLDQAKAKGTAYAKTKAKKQVLAEFDKMPVGHKFKIGNTTYEKESDGKFKWSMPGGFSGTQDDQSIIKLMFKKGNNATFSDTSGTASAGTVTGNAGGSAGSGSGNSSWSAPAGSVDKTSSWANAKFKKAATPEEVSDMKKKFVSAKLSKSKSDYDAKHRSETGKIWKNTSYDAKEAICQYTGSGYTNINDALRNDNAKGGIKKKINNITNTIKQSKMKEDTMLRRGVNMDAAAKFLGISYKDLVNADPDDLIGLEGHDDAFMSCGSAEGTGFKKQVNFNIFCPKGTEALYAEPISACGDGDGFDWDGESQQYTFSSEFETILQRGTKVVVVGVHKDDSQFYNQLSFDVIVTGQAY